MKTIIQLEARTGPHARDDLRYVWIGSDAQPDLSSFVDRVNLETCTVPPNPITKTEVASLSSRYFLN